MNLDSTIIGQRIKQARLNKNMTQEKLAEKLDVSVTFLSRIERGTIVLNLKRLSEICSILEISEGEILNGAIPNSNNYLTSEFSNLLKNCPADKARLIYDIAKIIINN